MALNTKDLAMAPNFHQNISLTGREAAYTIHGYEVDIHPSQASGTGQVPAGSNKVKITTITNQSWEHPKHCGNIVASNNQYLAYVLEGRNGYVIRLIHNDSNNRVLLKGFVGAILEVSFAHAKSNLLACVDEGGNVHIWDLDRVKKFEDTQVEALKIIVSRNTDDMFRPDNLEHRLVWSPYIPQEDDEEQDTCCIVVTHGNDVEVFDVQKLFKDYPNGLKILRHTIRNGIRTIKDAHEKVIYDVSLSPDGAVLATASEDGTLKFWQIDWSLAEGEKSKCLHDFKPHKGAPVTRLIFCDNHLSQDPSAQFWRFLLTAANDNTEVKVWCTVSWKCLQTFNFLPSIDASKHEPSPHILLDLDLSASYLLAADTKRMVLYILQLFHDSSLGDASVTSITEYLLTQPIYSFIVSGLTPIVAQEGSDSGDEGGGEEEAEKISMKDFDSRRSVVLIKLHCIQSKSMQELLVKFEPPDLMGIPPSSPMDDLLNNFISKQSSKSPPSQPSVPICSTATPLLSSPPRFASLPTDVQDSPTNSYFQSLPSAITNQAIGSPKLLTPSEFASPAKSPVSPSTLQSSSLPFIPLPTVPTKQEADKPEPSTGQASSSGETTSLPPPPVHQSPRTLTSATLTSVTEFHPTDKAEGDDEVNTSAQLFSDLSKLTEPIDSEEQQGQRPQGAELAVEPCNESCDLTGVEEEKRQEPAGRPVTDGDNPDGLNDLGASDSEEEEGSISTKEVQQSMNNIFDILQISSPHSRTDTSPPVNFNQFTKMLNDPALARHGESEGSSGGGALMSTEKSLALGEGPTTDEFVSLAPRPREKGISGGSSTGATEDNSEIVNATGAPTPAEHLQLLKEKIPPIESDKVPLLSDLGVTDESIAESVAECKKQKEAEETPWPDIGQLEMEAKAVKGGDKDDVKVKEEEGKGEKVKMNEGGAVPKPASATAGNEGEVPVISGLVMPSADIAIDMTMQPSEESRDLPDRSHDLPDKSHELPDQSRDQEEEEEVQEQSERDVTPGLPDQEGEGLGQEVGGAAVPTELVSKTKKKTRRGNKGKSKKTSANATFEAAAVLVDTGSSDSEQDPDLMAAVGQLSERLSKQREELDQLRAEQQNMFRSLQQKLDAMTAAIVGAQRTSLAEHTREYQQKLDRVLREKQQAEKQRQEALSKSLSQSLTTAVNAKLDKLVKNEMKNLVVPSVNRSMATLTEQLSAHLQNWLAMSSATVKETLTRALQSRGLPEQVGSAVAAGIASSYQDTFRVTVLPAFERNCMEMMKQIDENFRAGTADYLKQIQFQHQQYHNPPMQHLNASIQTLHSSLQSWVTPGPSSPLYSHIQSCLHQEMATLMQQTKQVMSEAVSAAVQKEVGAAMQEQMAKVNPEARLEEERKKKQEDIQRYVRSQQYNTAFEVALSTSDLQLVVHLCQQLSPDEVIDSSTSPLSQPVLLSLIQQLSVNLQDQLELKIKYLEQCILALDVSNEVTRSHMATVILQLSQQLASVERSFEGNPTATKPAIKKSVKRLKMMSERLCQPQ